MLIQPRSQSFDLLRKSPRQHSYRYAFTLLELLTVIAVIAILSTILVSVISNVRAKADQVNGLGKLRHFMMSAILYASEHENRAPGPAARAQYAVLRKNDNSQLSWLLRDYLNVPSKSLDGTPLPAIMPPRLQSLHDPNSTVAYFAVNNLSTSTRPIKPWGTVSGDYKDWTSEEDKLPKRFDEIPELARQVALIDMDLKLQGLGGGPVAIFNVMEETLYENSRNAAFWDGHVEAVPLDYKLYHDAD